MLLTINVEMMMVWWQWHGDEVTNISSPRHLVKGDDSTRQQCRWKRFSFRTRSAAVSSTTSTNQCDGRIDERFPDLKVRGSKKLAVAWDDLSRRAGPQSASDCARQLFWQCCEVHLPDITRTTSIERLKRGSQGNARVSATLFARRAWQLSLMLLDRWVVAKIEHGRTKCWTKPCFLSVDLSGYL